MALPVIVSPRDGPAKLTPGFKTANSPTRHHPFYIHKFTVMQCSSELHRLILVTSHSLHAQPINCNNSNGCYSAASTDPSRVVEVFNTVRYAMHAFRPARGGHVRPLGAGNMGATGSRRRGRLLNHNLSIRSCRHDLDFLPSCACTVEIDSLST